VVVGIHAVTELLNVRSRAVSQVWLRDKYIDHPELSRLFDLSKSQKVRVELKNPAVLDRVIASHQGVLAFTEEQPELDWPALEKAETATLVALDEVEDPHNLGAIMRTAWLLGARGILTPEHRSAFLSPAVSKVAQGAAEHLPVEPDNALPERLKRLKDHGFWVLGLSHKATQNLFELEIPKKVVWVLGSESSGLRKSVEGACDDLISIPQVAAEASYNVSVAAAMALAETFRQRATL
jgi:23S rRNA (guanosine2251-2'-O)-methyltransferase